MSQVPRAQRKTKSTINYADFDKNGHSPMAGKAASPKSPLESVEEDKSELKPETVAPKSELLKKRNHAQITKEEPEFQKPLAKASGEVSKLKSLPKVNQLKHLKTDSQSIPQFPGNSSILNQFSHLAAADPML